jgi:hypothetical protein
VRQCVPSAVTAFYWGGTEHDRGPDVGGVSLEIFSEKDPNTPITQPVEAATVERVWADFEPYRKGKKDK